MKTIASQPRRVGRYELGDPLGQGACATVYRGFQPRLGRPVAIKILNDSLAEDGHATARFLREVQALVTVRHENVVTILDHGHSGGYHYMVTELVEGMDLAKILAHEGKLTWARARRLMAQLLRGLRAIHDKGIVHRDLKPENCVVCRPGANDEFLKLIDFGVAGHAVPEDDDARLTGERTIVGTPAYMAPEQAQPGASLDHRADLYAVAAILFELLAARQVFEHELPLNMVLAQLNDQPPSISELLGRHSWEPVNEFLQRGLQKDPAERFQTATEMLEALLALEDPTLDAATSEDRTVVSRQLGSRGKRRRRSRLVGAAATVGALATSAGVLWFWLGSVGLGPVRQPSAMAGVAIASPSFDTGLDVDLSRDTDDLIAGLTPDARTTTKRPLPPPPRTKKRTLRRRSKAPGSEAQHEQEAKPAVAPRAVTTEPLPAIDELPDPGSETSDDTVVAQGDPAEAGSADAAIEPQGDTDGIALAANSALDGP